MTSTVTEQPFRVHTLDEFPQFTPQEMGRRMLALIDSIHSFDQFTLEHVRQMTGFPMEQVSPPGKKYAFAIHLPESDWYYGLDYSEHVNQKENLAWFDFNNPADAKGRLYQDYHVDMAPVCLDYDTCVAALERMGFEKKYDERHELGWVLATYYVRNNVKVQVVARREADQPEAKRTHACLESISISNWE